MRPSQTYLINMLRRFVSIPSINPGFQTPTDDPILFGEGRYAEVLVEELKLMGCDKVWLEEVLPGRANVMALVSGTNGSHKIALQSHLDTVQVGNMTGSPWGKLEGDKFYGRGSADPKACTVAQFAVLKHIIQQRHLAADVYFIGTVDEEYTAKGALHVGANYYFDGCFVGEPTELAPVVAHKGALRFELTADGVPCHSSQPELGHNAILEITSLLTAFAGPFGQYTKSHGHPLTGPATWAPTLITGGEGLNTIPASAKVAIDRRLVPGENANQVLDFVNHWLECQQKENRPWHLGQIFIADPPFLADYSSHLVRALQASLQNNGLQHSLQGVSYGTDASKITKSGTPCVVFGPGSIAQAHGGTEWVDVTAIGPACQVLMEAIEILDKYLQG